jgi:hypothetical protein
LDAQVSIENKRRRRTTFIGRVVMDKPAVRFALPAAVIAAVALGLFEFIALYQSGVVLAQEKNGAEKKEEKKQEAAGLGFTCRQRRAQTQPGTTQPMEFTDTIRESPAYGSRMDTYLSGRLFCSLYTNYADGTTVSLFHLTKRYTRRKGPKGPPPAEQTHDPRAKIKKALAGAHKELGRRMIEGVEAEGIEVPLVGVVIAGNNQARVKVESAVERFWSSVETGQPVLVEQEVVGGHGALRFKTIRDQFRWNVGVDPNEFKARIPPDYQLDTRQPGQGGGFGAFGQGSVSGPAGTPKSRQKARK